MQGSNLWKPIAVTEVTAESGVNLSADLPAVQALGLMWNAVPTTTCPSEPVSQLLFDASVASPVASGPFFMEPQIPSMPPMHAPSAALDNRGANQLLVLLGPLAGLSSLQIEEQLRSAAAQIDVYDD